jgi:hypothetical protein
VRAASFELAGGLSEITIGTARLGSQLVRVGTPRGSGAVPRLTRHGSDVRLTVSSRGGDPAKVTVLLDDRLVWTIRINGGTRRAGLDLTGAAVRRIDLDGGADRIDLALPRLRGTVPIRLSGGVHTWRIHTSGRVAVRLVARRGAGHVELYGRDRGGIGPGSTVTETRGSPGRIDLDAEAGVGSLTVSGD